MGEQGRLLEAEERIIVQTVPDIDYKAFYPGTIVSQNGQLFDFQPDSDKVPGQQGLKFYSGSPGIEITVDTNASPRAVLFFQNGDPRGAALAFFDFPGLSLLKIGNNATQGAARVNDPVEVSLTLVALSSFVFTAPSGGGPCTVTGGDQTLDGQITGGSTQVEIG